MSNVLHTRQRISELLGIFAWQAKAYTASGNTDFNRVSEDVLVPLSRLIFTLPDLKNLNTETKKNFPGIDLADDTAGIAFQVTATSDSQKIKDSLKTFVEKGFYNKYLGCTPFIHSGPLVFTLAGSEIGGSQKERYMKDPDLLELITLNPKVMAGNPIIKGTRLTVEYIVNLLAHGATSEEVLEE